MMTGRGGWPMSVFLTPEGKPFFGGTYWPPRARGGMPGFDQVLAGRGRRLATPPRRVARSRPTRSRSCCGEQTRRTDELRDDALAESSWTTRSLRSGRGGLAAVVRPAVRRLRPGAEISPAAGPAMAAAPLAAFGRRRAAADGHHHARPHGRRRHVRSSRRRLSSLQRRRPLAGAAFREDALRQRPAGRLLPRGLAGDRQTPAMPPWFGRRWTICSAT